MMCVKKDPDRSWGVEDETRRYSYPESSGKNWVQTEPQRYTYMGEGDEYLRFLSECRGGNLAGEPFHVWD